MNDSLQELLEKVGPKDWNEWKHSQGSKELVFRNRNFKEFIPHSMRGYDFARCHFIKCTFQDMYLDSCNFERSVFTGGHIVGEKSNFTNCNFRDSRFEKVEFRQTSFDRSIFSNCEFDHCTLDDLDFYEASLINSKFIKGSITNSRIFGANVWNINTNGTVQRDLAMPSGVLESNPEINQLSVDDIELGNVIYLLAANANLTKLINQSSSNFVLILGRFQNNAFRINAIKEVLRRHKLSPIVFDFVKPSSLDLIEMITLLSLLSKFIIVDLSKPKSVPAELQAILSTLMIPVVPIIQKKSALYSTFSFTKRYNWVLPVLVFDLVRDLVRDFKKEVVDPANAMHRRIVNAKQKMKSTREIKSSRASETPKG